MSSNKSSSSATAVDEQKSQLLQQEYNKSQQLIQQLESQSGTLASQLQEHIIVDQTLSSIPPEERQVGKRKCYKMIGGVLVEKSIDDVIKILHDEKNQLIKSKKEVDDELEKSRKKLESWISSNKIKIVKG
ncbi:Cochaperone prefoldin complex subunit [Lodderomyces elongisporus]|uniref:Cochaperone prefoldin complex subunit n=1 Tax=Lodderomyces elongisporus TaxID=36914 RepID=UPI00291F8786|nr:Cochaperone prefoldin complex subunit [Lodderomyces elongisporus]WLF77046.1 Cochaperone prefoldin complex subunit [Lodderomyces elongisporus]